MNNDSIFAVDLDSTSVYQFDSAQEPVARNLSRTSRKDTAQEQYRRDVDVRVLVPGSAGAPPAPARPEVEARLVGGIKLDRAIALMSSPQEYGTLQARHQQFARKKIAGTLTAKEEREYKMVLWELDRIEDAQMGDQLDLLERIAQRHEQLAAQVKQLYSHFSAPGTRRRSY